MASEMAFQKASKRKSKLRLCLFGASGSGKTFTALNITKHLGGRTALIDTERGSASKYADIFGFDVMELESFEPAKYIAAINLAVNAGYDNLIIDSLSHAWNGKNGLLEQHGNITARDARHDSFAAWRDITPLHNQLLDSLTQASIHLIATMRAKSEYVRETDDKGKTKITEVGIQPIQRDGMEYEFDVVGRLNEVNTLIITKSRCSALTDAIIKKPGQEFAITLKTWLSDGTAFSSPDTSRPLESASGTESPRKNSQGTTPMSKPSPTTPMTEADSRPLDARADQPGQKRSLTETTTLPTATTDDNDHPDEPPADDGRLVYYDELLTQARAAHLPVAGLPQQSRKNPAKVAEATAFLEQKLGAQQE